MTSAACSVIIAIGQSHQRSSGNICTSSASTLVRIMRGPDRGWRSSVLLLREGVGGPSATRGQRLISTDCCRGGQRIRRRSRSEERRVGKESRARWWADHEENKRERRVKVV